MTRQYFGGKPTIAALSGVSHPSSLIGTPSIKTRLKRIQVCEQPLDVLVAASYSAPQPLSRRRQISIAAFALHEH
jgi:hypothetical protein